MNCSVLFRFSNASKPSQTISIDFKFLKSCSDEVINRSRLTEFYHSNQLDEYLSLKQCKSIDTLTVFQSSFFSSSSKSCTDHSRDDIGLFIDHCIDSLSIGILHGNEFILYLSIDNFEKENIGRVNLRSNEIFIRCCCCLVIQI